MTANQVSIGQVKRDISELVNRVAFGGERIILTSRGKPKAVLVSVEDYELLEQLTSEARQTRWAAWQQASEALAGQILARRQGEPIDVDQLWQAARAELEERDEHAVGD
jgi:prevent-host-death family protein